MIELRPMTLCVALLALVLPACSKSQPEKAAASQATTTPAPIAAPIPLNTSDPIAFVPLRSDAVKDAIHRALSTGQTQRWADGALSGYAVPSMATDAHGCRAVRYTVDQRPGAPFETINACDAGR